MPIKLSRIFKKILLAAIVLSLITSCAIHAKFPFICFRWSCIAAEFKLPSVNTKAMKKQRQAKALARKKKRQRDKNKRLRKKGVAIPDNDVVTGSYETPVKKDSLKYGFKAQGEERYIIISFNRASPDKADSVFVRYNTDEDDVLEYDKQILKNYLDSNAVEKITLINVREHFGDKKEDEFQNRHTSITKEHIAGYFIKLGIPREKIKLTNRK